MEELGEKKERWQKFITNPCWIELVEVLKAQQRMRSDKVMLTPLVSLDGALEVEYTKGEFNALAMIPELPNTILEGLEMEIKQKVEENNETAS